MKKTSTEYTVINYFDVWGNEIDGYEVNNQCEQGSIIIPDDVKDFDIVIMMKDLGYLSSAEGVSISNTGDGYELEDAYNAFPLYGLVPVYN
jgi:hypothetical protein